MKYVKLRESVIDYVAELTKKVTVNTFKPTDRFYFKTPVLIGKINSKDAYVTSYDSHYNEYLVFGIVFDPSDINGFTYLNHNDLLLSEKACSNYIDGKFVPTTRKLEIYPNFLELIFNATNTPENIDFCKHFQKLKKEEETAKSYLFKHKDEIDTFDVYKKKRPYRLKMEEYKLEHDRYFNLNPDIEREKEYKKKLNLTDDELLIQYEKDKKSSAMMKDILDDILKGK